MKAKPLLIISVTLIIGFAIGFLTSSMISHQRMKRIRSFNSAESFKRRTIHLIEPTEEQKKEILPLIDEYGKKMNQIRKDFGKEFFSLMKDFHNDIKPFLTDEQIERLEYKQRPPQRDSHSGKDSTGRDSRYHGRPSKRGS